MRKVLTLLLSAALPAAIRDVSSLNSLLLLVVARSLLSKLSARQGGGAEQRADRGTCLIKLAVRDTGAWIAPKYLQESENKGSASAKAVRYHAT